MAPTKEPKTNRGSNYYGEDDVRQANVLASCYLVDAAGALNGLHYCTTNLTGQTDSSLPVNFSRRDRNRAVANATSQGPSGIPEVPSSGLPSPPSSPPLAAITADNELALAPKKRSGGGNITRLGRRGGATLRIREECERFFCETMAAVFHGERDTAEHGSGLTGVYNNDNNNNNFNNFNNYGGGGNGQLGTPPDDSSFPGNAWAEGASAAEPGAGAAVSAWLEIWDYAGGASFRGFVAADGGDKSLFAFFDAGIVGRDLKQALVALIELADSALACPQLVICISRSMPADEAKELTKGLQWAGFSPTTLDHWTGGYGLDVISKRWVFMGMEI